MSAIVSARGLAKRYDRTRPWPAWTSTSRRARSSGWSAPTAPARRPPCACWPRCSCRRAATPRSAGVGPQRPDAVRRVIGFMPDVFGVYDDMKVWEYLDFFARCYGLSAARRRRMIGDLLELVDLGDKRDTYVQGLSRGMQQRLCLAHALVHDPAVLLLDEPASGLDPRARVELRELLRELRSLGKTILISSHILPSSRSCARASRSWTAARSWPRAGSPTSSGGCARGPCCGSGSSPTATALEAARAHFGADPEVATARLLDDGTIEIGFRGDDAASARLLREAIAAGLPTSRSRGPRATSRSCSSRSPPRRTDLRHRRGTQ